MTPDPKRLNELRIDRAKPRRGRPFLFLAVLVLLLALGGGGAYWWYTQPKAAAVQTAVVRETVSGGDNTLLNASGYVTARRAATISSKVTGKVLEVLVEEGLEVKEGQVLARLDAANVEQSFRLAEAQLASMRESLDETRVNIELADRELKRFRELVAEEVASQADLDRAEAEAKSLRARLERQQADVEVAAREVSLWKQQLDDNVIRAPFGGVVTSKNAQPGEMISPVSAGGGFTRTGICTIVDMNSLEIEVDVSESYINRVASGQPVEATLDSYPDWKIPAKVIAIIPTADRQKATVKVRVGFLKLDPRILPDMSVKVAFQNSGEVEPETRRITVPLSAVQQRDGKDVLWVVTDGKAERRAVTLGAADGNAVAVEAGVAAGEKIIVEGAESLEEGARVTESQA